MPPAPPSAAITQTWSGCQVTVEFTWSGFKGPAGSVDAVVRLYMNGNHEGTGTANGVDPSGGTSSTTFGVDTSATPNNFHVDGRLVKPNIGRTVRRSLITSSVESHNCFAD
jgi:hypothetical protein